MDRAAGRAGRGGGGAGRRGLSRNRGGRAGERAGGIGGAGPAGPVWFRWFGPGFSAPSLADLDERPRRSPSPPRVVVVVGRGNNGNKQLTSGALRGFENGMEG